MSKKPVEKPAKAESHTYDWRQRAGLLRGAPKPKAKKEKAC